MSDLKVTIGNNILFLMSVYGLSRKDFCKELDIKYTTLCDWIGAKSYPRIETLLQIADFFSVEIQYFFTDIEKDEEQVARIMDYVRRLNMAKTYESTYPKGFFELFGTLSDSDLEEPEDFPADEPEVLL